MNDITDKEKRKADAYNGFAEQLDIAQIDVAKRKIESCKAHYDVASKLLEIAKYHTDRAALFGERLVEGVCYAGAEDAEVLELRALCERASSAVVDMFAMAEAVYNRQTERAKQHLGDRADALLQQSRDLAIDHSRAIVTALRGSAAQ
jgi:hypothetical protein